MSSPAHMSVLQLSPWFWSRFHRFPFHVFILEELYWCQVWMFCFLCIWCIYILFATYLDGCAAACKVIFLSLRGRHHQVLKRYCIVGALHESKLGDTVSSLILCGIVIMLFLAQWRITNWRQWLRVVADKMGCIKIVDSGPEQNDIVAHHQERPF